jgi:2-keto-3-deoxy-galactonokinase
MSGVVVLPGTHFLVVRFEQANVKKFQLHNMGEEAERYVGVVSLSLSIAT